MAEFLQAVVSFPTVVFSVLMIPVILYWLLVILGAFDLDVLDSLFAGAGEVLDGALEGLGGEAVDGALEGLGDGLELDADVDADLDADADAGDGHSGGVLGLLGLGGVPLTVSLSILIFAAWILSILGMELVGGAGWTYFQGVLGAALVMVLALACSVVLTSRIIRPLRPLFATTTATEHRQLVAKRCTVTTQRVDANFGQAEVLDAEGASLIVQVRNPDPNPLTRGSRGLLYDYDPVRGTFLVAPFEGDSTR